MLLFIRTSALSEKQNILLDFYAVHVSQHGGQSSIRPRIPFAEGDLAYFRQRLNWSGDKVFSALGTAVLVVAKC